MKTVKENKENETMKRLYGNSLVVASFLSVLMISAVERDSSAGPFSRYTGKGVEDQNGEPVKRTRWGAFVDKLKPGSAPENVLQDPKRVGDAVNIEKAKISKIKGDLTNLSSESAKANRVGARELGNLDKLHEKIQNRKSHSKDPEIKEELEKAKRRDAANNRAAHQTISDQLKTHNEGVKKTTEDGRKEIAAREKKVTKLTELHQKLKKPSVLRKPVGRR